MMISPRYCVLLTVPLLIGWACHARAATTPAGSVGIGAFLLNKPPVTISPVIQYMPPTRNGAPAFPHDLATPAIAAGTYYAIPAVGNAAPQNPTTPPPAPVCPEPPAVSTYNLNNQSYSWPTVAQSVSWWASQPGAPTSGTYAYHVGSTISHQQAEGYILSGGCTPTVKPTCSTGVGVTNGYTWGGNAGDANQIGWIGGCQYTPPPTCPSGSGHVNGYSWSGAAWTGSCQYVAPPSCPAGYVGGMDYWTGSTWVLTGCHLPATQPVTQPTQPPGQPIAPVTPTGNPCSLLGYANYLPFFSTTSLYNEIGGAQGARYTCIAISDIQSNAAIGNVGVPNPTQAILGLPTYRSAPPNSIYYNNTLAAPGYIGFYSVYPLYVLPANAPLGVQPASGS